MAKAILAISSRHRNFILDFYSSNSGGSSNKYPELDNNIPYSYSELNTPIGLAFAAVLAEAKHIDRCKSELNVFLTYRDSSYHPGTHVKMTAAITHLFENGFSAFKFLGYPRYFDDFILAYHCILNSSSILFPDIKEEMQRILREIFLTR